MYFFITRRYYLIFGSIGVIVVGCTTLKDTPKDSWHFGYIERIALGTEKGIDKRECVAKLEPELVAQSRFAVVRYSSGRWRKYRTVFLPANSKLKAGDQVRMNLLDCASPLMPHDGSPS